jgi:hypothetical protein
MLVSPKAFLQEKERYQKNEETTEDHFLFGTMVDIMLVGHKEEFDNKFHRIPDSIDCSDTVKNIVNNVFADAQEDRKEGEDLYPLDHYPDFILEHCNYQLYYNNLKDETRVKKIIDQGTKYFEILSQGMGKSMVTESEYAAAVNCMMALKSDQFTKKFVDRKLDPKNVEFLDRVVVEFELDGIEMKGELDRVAIDHSLKLIMPIDFKTTSKSILNFESDFWYYRYDFQAATYKYGLQFHPKIQELLKDGYEMDPFRYIVVEKSLYNNPMVFVISQEATDVGMNGGELSNNKSYEGLRQAIHRYKYAEENNLWDYPMEYYENNGFIYLSK